MHEGREGGRQAERQAEKQRKRIHPAWELLISCLILLHMVLCASSYWALCQLGAAGSQVEPRPRSYPARRRRHTVRPEP